MKTNSKDLLLRISLEDYERWKAQAIAERRSLTNFIEVAVSEYCDRKKKAK